MPTDDLLRFIIGPLPYSGWSLWTGLGIVAGVIVWCAGVAIWTMDPAALRTMPVIRGLHAKLVRRRFARSIRATCERYRAGSISAQQASAAVSRTVRAFLYLSTGVRAQFQHVGEIAGGELAGAGPLLAALNDVQFNRDSVVDVDGLGRSAEEFVASWH